MSDLTKRLSAKARVRRRYPTAICYRVGVMFADRHEWRYTIASKVHFYLGRGLSRQAAWANAAENMP